MDESVSEKQPPVLSRRKFLRGGGALAVAAPAVAIGIDVVGKEAASILKGEVKTDSGTFIPLYELHDKGVSPETIPPNLDGYFREIQGSGVLSDIPPKDLFRLSAGGYASLSSSGEVATQKSLPEGIILPKEVLAKLARQDTEIIFGDIQVPLDSGDDIYKIGADFYRKAMLALLPGRIPAVANAIDSKVGVGRRSFLEKLMAAGLIWSLSNKMGGQTFRLAKNIFKEDNVATRIAARMEGIAVDLHPEIPAMFFRNLIMADKMLTVAKQMKQEKGRNPRIAFQVEGRHSGIEDFLALGQEGIHMLISAHPKSWRDRIVEINDGPETFSTARLFKFPSGFKPEDLSNDEQMDKVTERKIVDTKLQESLS